MVPYPKSVLESRGSGSAGRTTRESKNEEQQSGETLSRRAFVGSLAAMSAVAPAPAPASALDQQAAPGSLGVATMSDAILSEKIRRARLSGPSQVTANATVAEMGSQGRLVVLSKGTNEWVCCPGNENIIGDVPMALDPMGM